MANVLYPRDPVCGASNPWLNRGASNPWLNLIYDIFPLKRTRSDALSSFFCFFFLLYL